MADASFVQVRLQAFYEQTGISAKNFQCKYFERCRADSSSFVTAQETYVGPEYGDRLPRLLFLSLDSGSLNADPESRTMEAVRRRVLTSGMGPRGRHWYETHRLALTLLQPFDATLRIERTSRLFAHMNAAKCCQNKEGHAKADGVLFDNCREYIGEEIRILAPDVLVTQGREARLAVEHHFGRVAVHPVQAGSEDVWGIVRLSETRRAIWLPTFHPRYYAKFWAQAEHSWPVFRKLVEAFMRGTLPEVPTLPPDEVLSAQSRVVGLRPAPTVAPDGGAAVFVWVNSQDGWVVHGGARSSYGRALIVANLLERRKGWQTHAGASAPEPCPVAANAPSRVVAMTSPVTFD